MLSSSIAHRTLRDRLIKAFQGQGYTLDERNADIGVAFYASVHERLDVRLWNYGYPFYPGWYGPVETVTPYPEGTVIVDVVRLSSHELLWRGRGSVEYSDDPTENLNRLGKAADMIVARFPRAAPVMVGERR